MLIAQSPSTYPESSTGWAAEQCPPPKYNASSPTGISCPNPGSPKVCNLQIRDTLIAIGDEETLGRDVITLEMEIVEEETSKIEREADLHQLSQTDGQVQILSDPTLP